MTPHERERKFHLAFAQAAKDFDVDKVVEMAAAVDWRWRGQKIDRDMVLDALISLHRWALRHDWNKHLAFASHHTGGMHICAQEYPGDGDEVHVSVQIMWGAFGEGDSE